METPLMKQYQEMKKQHPDAIILFRVGDFYEMFGQDAIDGSEILGITLTKRFIDKTGKSTSKTIELAGFPHHALDTYLPKIIRAGRRVAICEQLEDPKLTKKPDGNVATTTSEPEEKTVNGFKIGDEVLYDRDRNGKWEKQKIVDFDKYDGSPIFDSFNASWIKEKADWEAVKAIPKESEQPKFEPFDFPEF